MQLPYNSLAIAAAIVAVAVVVVMVVVVAVVVVVVIVVVVVADMFAIHCWKGPSSRNSQSLASTFAAVVGAG